MPQASVGSGTKPAKVRTAVVKVLGCPLWGEEYARRSGRRVLAITHFHLGSLSATIEVDDPASNTNSGEATITVSGPFRRFSLDGLNTAAKDLCWLLSLASNSLLVPYDFPTETGRMISSVHGWLNRRNEHIDFIPGDRIRRFVEATWQGYRRVQGARPQTATAAPL